LQVFPRQRRRRNVSADRRNRLCASLKHQGLRNESDRALLENSLLKGNPTAALTANASDPVRFCSGPSACSSDLTRNARRTNYYIDPDNDARRGADWAEVMRTRRVGLYGHVVPLRLTRAEAYDRTRATSGADAANELYYKIEYWQFFGYSSNNKPF